MKKAKHCESCGELTYHYRRVRLPKEKKGLIICENCITELEAALERE